MTTSVRLRRPKKSDFAEIEGIAENYEFPLADRFNRAAITHNEEKIISIGVLRSILEAIIMFSGNKRDRVESLKQQIDIAKSDARELGYDDVYVFAESPEFASILIKHFGFRKAKGVPLILDV